MAPPYIWILTPRIIYGHPTPYHVDSTTELLSIHKRTSIDDSYVTYSAYQVKTVNCRQPIQVPLKYFDNYFDGYRHNRSLLARNMALEL